MRYGIASKLIIIAVSISMAGCSLQKMGANMTVGVLAVGAKAFFEEPDWDLAGAAMPANLKTMEALGVLADDNPVLYNILAQSYCSYAFGWLEPDLMTDTRPELDDAKVAKVERVKATFARGRKYGMRALELRHSEFEGAVDNINNLRAALEEVEEEDLSDLFWATYCWMSELQYMDLSVASADANFVRLNLEKILEMDSEFYYGLANVLLGSLEAFIPESFGGRPAVAKELFEKALKISDRTYLNTQVAYAQYYAVNQLDRELFEALLQETLDADTYILPAENLANQIAKARARALLAIADDLF